MGSPETDLTSTIAEQLSRPVADLTPARVFEGHIDGSYRTSTLLELQAAQALARRAVTVPLDLTLPALAPLRLRFGLYEVSTLAGSVQEHVANPTLGRRLSESALATIREHSLESASPKVQLVIGDGLSAAAVHTQVPALLPKLVEGAQARAWQVATPLVVHHCRVGALGDIGPASGADLVILLIGERPGLATAESLSAYLQYRPQPGETDANRNVISNIHAGGLSTELATARILQLTAAILAATTSGVTLAT